MRNILNYFIEKINPLIKVYEKEVFLPVTVIFVGLLGFGLGRLSKIEDQKVPIIIKQAITSTVATSIQGKYVASRTGNFYYMPWCTTVKKIKEVNKVWFNNEDEAHSAGYTKASNCKGL